jgi:hypothetical protein
MAETLDERLISQAHTIDDLARFNGKARRTARDYGLLLIDARHALNTGRVEVVDEYLDRTIRALHDLLQS